MGGLTKEEMHYADLGVQILQGALEEFMAEQRNFERVGKSNFLEF